MNEFKDIVTSKLKGCWREFDWVCGVEVGQLNTKIVANATININGTIYNFCCHRHFDHLVRKPNAALLAMEIGTFVKRQLDEVLVSDVAFNLLSKEAWNKAEEDRSVDALAIGIWEVGGC